MSMTRPLQGRLLHGLVRTLREVAAMSRCIAREVLLIERPVAA